MTITILINRSSVCLLDDAQLRRLKPTTGNIQNFRIPNKVGDEKNSPYKVIYDDIKDPIRVNDDRKLKK